MPMEFCDFPPPPIADQAETCGLNPVIVQVSQSRTAVPGSPRGHVRSYSDVTPTVADEHDSRQAQPTDKKTVKTILSHLLPTSTAMAPIQVGLHLRMYIFSAKRKFSTSLPEDTCKTILTVK